MGRAVRAATRVGCVVWAATRADCAVRAATRAGWAARSLHYLKLRALHIISNYKAWRGQCTLIC